MTVDQYNTNLNKFLIDIEKNNRPLAIAAQSSVQQIGNRIFEEGKKTDGSKIGQYSTSPAIYVNPNFAIKKNDTYIKGGGKLQGLLPTIGKPTKENKQGERFFTEKTKHRGAKGTKAGDPHKTTYLSGGYKELRNRTGKSINYVNLVYSGNFSFDFRKGKVGVPTKIDSEKYTIQLDSEINIKKAEGFEKKYDTIFDPSTKEVETFERNANLEFQNALEKYELV